MFIHMSQYSNKNESIKEFDTIFENLLKNIHNEIILKDGAILLQYTNYFEGNFGFVIRNKSLKTLVEAK
jgi:hypothetical protein